MLEAVPPERLVMTFASPQHAAAESQVTFTIEPHQDIVRLTVTHENLAEPADHEAVAVGWPAVMANLKSLLETGKVLSTAPWEMAR